MTPALESRSIKIVSFEHKPKESFFDCFRIPRCDEAPLEEGLSVRPLRHLFHDGIHSTAGPVLALVDVL